jgi:DNA end-binding protein Ku
MADQRPIWRGHLRLALVSCPVALYAARHGRATLHFHLINPDTGNRVRMVTRDAETEEELSRSDLVKGYEVHKDRYVIMTDTDFEQARTESSSVMKIEKFVPQDSINPIYFESSYYVAPDGDGGEDVYVVLRDAIARTGMAAISRLVIAQRERVVALTLMGKGLVAHTLHETRDLNDAASVFAHVPNAKPDPEMIKLAEQLIRRQTGEYDPADFEDRYEKRLREVIEAKVKGEGIAPAEPEPSQSNVIDLMAALRQSLGEPGDDAPAGKRAKPTGKPAPAKAPRPADPPAKASATPPAKTRAGKRK